MSRHQIKAARSGFNGLGDRSFKTWYKSEQRIACRKFNHRSLHARIAGRIWVEYRFCLPSSQLRSYPLTIMKPRDFEIRLGGRQGDNPVDGLLGIEYCTWPVRAEIVPLKGALELKKV